MRKTLPPCLFALALAAVSLAAPAAAAPDPVRIGPAPEPAGVRPAEKAPSVIPAPRAEPVVPPSPAKSIATELNAAFVSVFEHVAPSVVVIDVTKKVSADGDGSEYLPDFFKPPGNEGSSGDGAPPPSFRAQKLPPSEGSGFIIQAGGFILTNYHVVTNEEKILVTLKDGRRFPGKVVGTDEKSDIAVVKIEAADLPVAELADSEAVRVGEIVFAIGVPYKLAYSFTQGVVSATGRNQRELDIPTQQDSYEDYIQTDASINPGNSGGPLVDLDGKVIGMNTLINGLNRGLGFSIPSNMLREIGDQLIHAGRVVRPYIGVRIVSVGEDTSDRYGSYFNAVKKGVIVETILPDTPAFHSELHTADVITEVDGVPVGSDRELQKQILAKKVGATVQLSVFRRGKMIKVPVTTGELPATMADNGGANGPGAGVDAEVAKQDTKALYGLGLQDLTRELAASLGLGANGGVLVSAVADDSPAARAGILVRDVITAVDDKPVQDLAAFKAVAKGADVKRGILCYIDRASGKTFVVIKAE